MNDERMMILKMLEEGKISSGEAAKLLEALKEGNTSSAKKTETGDQKYTNNSNNPDRKWAKEMEEKVDKIGKNMDTWSKDFSKKVEVLSKEMEPKLHKVTQTIVEKTATLADKISKTLSDPDFVNKFNTGVRNVKEKKLEMPVSQLANGELRLSGKNGMVFVKGYNGDKITLKVSYAPKNSEKEAIELTQSGEVFYLNYDESDFQSVSIEAFVPEAVFQKAHIESTNGKVLLETFQSEKIYVDTTNSRIDLKDIQGKVIKGSTTNAKILLENIRANELNMETSNGTIEVKKVDVEKLDLETSNASINTMLASEFFAEFDQYDWKFETSNAAIKVNLPQMETIAYQLKANTSLSGIQVNVPKLNYKENEKTYIDATSYQYEDASKKVKLILDTSNAPIIIEG